MPGEHQPLAGPPPPVLPDQPSDERDEAWAEAAAAQRDREWYDRERPPHHE
jgi:hypothetical protein